MSDTAKERWDRFTKILGREPDCRPEDFDRWAYFVAVDQQAKKWRQELTEQGIGPHRKADLAVVYASANLKDLNSIKQCYSNLLWKAPV